MGSVVTLVLAEWFSPLRPRPSFKTAGFAGLKSCPPRSSPIAAEPARTKGVQTAPVRKNRPPVLLIKIINNNYYYL